MTTLINLLLCGAILGITWYIWGDEVSAAAKQTVEFETVYSTPHAADWAGRYRGAVPCGEVDCSLRELDLTLGEDNTFEMIERVTGASDDPQFYSGSPVWEDNNSVIVIAQYRFKVAEGALELLSVDDVAPDRSKTYLLLLTQ